MIYPYLFLALRPRIAPGSPEPHSFVAQRQTANPAPPPTTIPDDVPLVHSRDSFESPVPISILNRRTAEQRRAILCALLAVCRTTRLRVSPSTNGCVTHPTWPLLPRPRTTLLAFSPGTAQRPSPSAFQDNQKHQPTRWRRRARHQKIVPRNPRSLTQDHGVRPRHWRFLLSLPRVLFARFRSAPRNPVSNEEWARRYAR